MPTIRDPQYRAEQVVLSLPTSIPVDREHDAVNPEPWWVDHLVAAERAIRALRIAYEAKLTTSPRTCDSCGTAIAGRSDRRFCSAACRVRAHRNG